MQLVGHRYAAIIFQSFRPGWLSVVGNKGNAADFKAVTGGEEGHIGWVIVNRINQTAFFQNDVSQTFLFGVQAAGQTNGAAADDDYVV